MEYGHKISKVYLNTKIFESFIRIYYGIADARISFSPNVKMLLSVLLSVKKLCGNFGQMIIFANS